MAGGLRRTKIVCTVGPASASVPVLRALSEAGMNVARLNYSHGDRDWHRQCYEMVRQVERTSGRPISVLQDLSGPKLRIGRLPEEGLPLTTGQLCRLRQAEEAAGGDPPVIPVPLPELFRSLKPGHEIFLDDGLIQLQVVERLGDEIVCEVLFGGCLTGRKGLAAPSTPIEIAALTEKDLDDLDAGLALGVDWVAVSFVRKASDFLPVRRALQAAGSGAGLIAKIERPEAVDNIEEILQAADGLMVARGDLGVEMPLEQVPIIQKQLIRRCYSSGKPVITATQMLESMTHSPRPTRAEVTDVANAIVDGTSAVMLSGETAVGAYPERTVKMMASIADHTEKHLDYRRLVREAVRRDASSITDAISQGVLEIAMDLNAAAILCSTTSGFTPRMVSRLRPPMPIIAATARISTFRRLPLIWGVHPLLVAATTSTDEMLQATVRGALEAGWITKGQTVVITSGVPVGTPGHTNLIKVETV